MASLFSILRSRDLDARASAPAAAGRGIETRHLVIMAAAFALAGVFAFAEPVRAGIGNIIAIAIAFVLEIFVGWLGQLLLILVKALIWIAQYNGFVTSYPVENGWTIVRDVTNMFFILVLLVIAFGTILGVDAYSYKNKQLSRLLIMAIVVNFSKTICGLLIDFAQVVMLTFVYGFKEAAGGNFADGLGITRLMQMRAQDEPPSPWAIAIALAMALLFLIIACGVVIIMCVVLAVRIVYLWLLVIMSPLAFFLKAVPGGAASKYYAEWWSTFTNQVIVGPIMAFFLWLALISLADNRLSSRGFPSPAAAGAGEEQLRGEVSEAFQEANVQGFIIAICMLCGSVIMGQRLSQSAAGLGKSIATGAPKAVTRGAKAIGGAAAKYSGAQRAYEGLKERGLSAATRIPLVGGAAGQALSKHRAAMATRADKATGFLKNLTPEERARLAGGIAVTPERAAIKKEALRYGVKDAADKPPTDEKGRQKFFAQKKELQKMATKDPSIKKDIAEVERKRPSLIIDPNETDAGERKRQQDAFRKAARSVNASKLAEMDPSELTKEFLTHASPKAIVEAQKNASGDQLAALQAMGATEDEVRKKQDAFKMENIALLEDSEKFGALKNRLTGKDEAARAAELTGLAENSPEVLVGAIAAAAPAIAAMQAIPADKQTADQKQQIMLLEQISRALGEKSESVSKLPGEMKSNLVEALSRAKVSAPAAVLAAGGSADQAFRGYSSKSGKFASDEDRAHFRQLIAGKGSAKSVASAMAADDIMKGGATNQVAIDLIQKLDGGDVAAMAREGKADNALAVVSSAEAIAKKHAGAAAGSQEAAWRDSAKQLLAELKATGNLSVASSMTFTGRAGGAVAAGAAGAKDAASAALRSAASKVSDTARRGKEVLESAGERVRKAGRKVKRSRII